MKGFTNGEPLGGSALRRVWWRWRAGVGGGDGFGDVVALAGRLSGTSTVGQTSGLAAGFNGATADGDAR